jgi:hypothetical protein
MNASPAVILGFAFLPVLVALVVVVGFAAAGEWSGRPGRLVRAGALAAVWLAATALLAATGVLGRFQVRPPPFLLLMAFLLVASVALALSPAGAHLARLPLFALVSAQAFRLPLELVMHQAAREGVMPTQMSFQGYNFDIVTGALAAVLAIVLWRWPRTPRWLVIGWNVLGALLLANVMAIAIASTPVVHAFGTDPAQLNTFVAHWPFVWLPTVLVPVALIGHIVVARRLRAGG